MNKPEVTAGHIDALRPDLRNANKGTEYGGHLLEKSLRENGAGRSVLADKNGNLIAGNKTTEKWGEIGNDDVIIVKTDGTKLVVVQRTDIDIDSPAGRALALADNQVGRVNLDFDMDVVTQLSDDFDIDLADWGLSSFETPTLKKEKDLDELATQHTCPNCNYTW